MASNRLRMAASATAFFVSALQAAPNPLDQAAELAMRTELAKKAAEYAKSMQESEQGLQLPALVSLSVGEAGAIAQVVYASGMPRMIRVGEILQPGVTVLDINLFGVLVRANGRKMPLPFQTTEEGAQQPAINSPFVPAPDMSTGLNVPAPMPAARASVVEEKSAVAAQPAASVK